MNSFEAFNLFCAPCEGATSIKDPFTLPALAELEAMCDGSGRRVYFIALHEVIKVGVTGDVADRVSALQVGCPYELELLGSIKGDPRAEAALHAALCIYRVRGEWFMAPKEMRAAIRGLLGAKEAAT